MDKEKYFIIIYPRRPADNDYWKEINPLCTNINNNDKYSNKQQINGINVYFYEVENEVKADSLKNFFNSVRINKNDEIIIFGHKYEPGHPGISEAEAKSLKQDYSSLEYRLFTTGEPNSYPCKLLRALNKGYSQGQFQENIFEKQLEQKGIYFNWKTLKEEVKKKPNILSLLHHRIAHLFLPMDVDLMGIWEIAKKDKNTALEYLKEVLEGKSENYYRQKLAKLQYMIAGDKVDFKGCDGKLEIDERGQIKECNPVKFEDPDLLAEGKSIYDLILELGEEKKNKIFNSNEWKDLLKHCGLKQNGENFEPAGYDNSPILQFMCLMDSKIKNISDVEDILNFNPKEEPLNENELWFHKWFCELDKYLNQLKDKIGQ